MNDAVPGGVRARVRQAITDELCAAALRLFEERGYDRTTVDDIVEVVGISQRTFFRYFATKEDLLLRWGDDLSPLFVGRLRGRPADEAPWTALRRCLDVLTEDPGRVADAQLLMRIMTASPALSARITQRRLPWARELEVALAERMGTDPADDLRPSVLAAAALSALSIAVTRSIEQPREGVELGAVLDQAFAALAPVD